VGETAGGPSVACGKSLLRHRRRVSLHRKCRRPRRGTL